ncbi:MAG: 1-acyl-sn-glycerol-3-phosphate acyltransferase [Myxococcales bacterium FL481]|nr:MAG: 1-acyl-sn-glycerol-3-phosphate acyltransferase [Myxococcales bacterium FL481]
MPRGRSVLRTIGVLGWTSTLVAVAEVHRWSVVATRRREVYDRYVRVWSRGLLRILGVVVTEVDATTPTVPSGPMLVVANHRSALDIPILLARFGGVALSRGDVARWPMIGFVARRAQTIFVDRGSVRSKAAAIRSIRGRLGDGHRVSVFPEGTTYPGDEVRPFAAGAFVAAAKHPVLPVGLAYPPNTEFGAEESFAVHAGKILARSSTPVTICVGEPHAPGQPSARADAARSAVSTLVGHAREGAEGAATAAAADEPAKPDAAADFVRSS